MLPSIGDPVPRVDGLAKVTGSARYAADTDAPGVAHAVLVGSTVAAGLVTRIDTSRAEAADGVLLVLTHENRGRLGKVPTRFLRSMLPDTSRPPLEDDTVRFYGQYVAMVVAETLEQARFAALLVEVEYERAPFAVRAEDSASRYEPPRHNAEKLQVAHGDVERGLASAAVRVSATYTTPVEHGSAMELHATVASWHGDRLTVNDATQFMVGEHALLAATFSDTVPKLGALVRFGRGTLFPGGARDSDDGIRVLAPYVGGMFGTKFTTGGHVVLTALAARRLRRPVKTVLTRQQVLTVVGHRPHTSQRIELGAGRDGRLVALRHDIVSHTNIDDDYVEPANLTSRMLYACPNYASRHENVRLNVMKPGWMRAPGEAPGQFALEAAMDELAYELGTDPLELRRRNHTLENTHTGQPFSSKHLLACYDRGAERFGWSARNPEPATTRDGDDLVGWGMATATLPAHAYGARAVVRVERDGDGVRAIVSSGAYDAGMGTFTVMAQLVAHELGLPLDAVHVVAGDSHLTPCFAGGGSGQTASVAPAIAQACAAVRRKLPATTAPEYREHLDRAGLDHVQGEGSTGGRHVLAAEAGRMIPWRKGRFCFQSFGAHFVELRVQPDIGRVRVSRVVSVFDVGRVLNARTTRSQLIGGIVMGIGAALCEELVYDPAGGQAVNADLAGYLVPVHADIPAIEVDWIGEPDLHFNSLGCRGVGEVSIVGLAAAVANAVFHATGVRVRDLPITPEKLLVDA